MWERLQRNTEYIMSRYDLLCDYCIHLTIVVWGNIDQMGWTVILRVLKMPSPPGGSVCLANMNVSKGATLTSGINPVGHSTGEESGAEQ